MHQRLLIALLCIHVTSLAQNRFSDHPQHSLYSYYYSVSDNEALKIYRSNGRWIQKYLHHKVDSFLTLFPVQKKLSPGHYLKVHTSGNRLVYELMTVGDIECRTIPNRRDLALFIFNSVGAAIKNADVTIGHRPIRYDASTNSYIVKDRRRGGTVKVVHENKTSFFAVNKSVKRGAAYRSPIWRQAISKVVSIFQRQAESGYYFNSTTRHEKHYSGYMVFNKPKYKPGDTVKLKAFINTKYGKAVNRPLILRLTDRDFYIDTILGTIRPYRAGGYNYEFVLNNSMDLDLDESYLLTFEELSSKKFDVNEYDGDEDEDEYAMRRKVLIRNKFEFEEYELSKARFEARASHKEHQRYEKLSLFLKGVDENGLPIVDGRVKITIKPQNVSRYASDSVFVPNILWDYTQTLETVGETRIDIPDTVFPNASFSYQINCEFRTSDNDGDDVTLYQRVHADTYEIRSVLKQDSITIEQLKDGIAIESTGILKAFNKRGIQLSSIDVKLPGTYKRNPAASYYVVQSEQTSVQVKNASPTILVYTDRTRDSVFITVKNSGRVKFWYSIFAGSRLVKSGYSDALAFAEKSVTKKNYLVTIQSFFNDEMQVLSNVAAYYDKELLVSWDAPQAVFPGQETTINIDVKNANGKPESNVDVTAFAFTSKFDNASMPAIPSYSKRYPLTFGPNRTFQMKPVKLIDSAALVWKSWASELGIDSNEYYRLMYTDSVHIFSEWSADFITQFAPFVVENGRVEPIHMLYIDNEPVFFSQADHYRKYSFRISPGKHVIQVRTSGKMITLKPINFAQGEKTYLGINSSVKNTSASVRKMPHELTKWESNLLDRYTILVEKKRGEHVSYIRQNDQYFLIDLPEPRRDFGYRSLVGPIKPTSAYYYWKREFETPFTVEGGFHFEFSKGLIKQRQIPNGFFRTKLSSFTTEPAFYDHVMTGEQIEKLWNNYLDARSATTPLFHNALSYANNYGELKIQIDSIKGKQTFIRNIILFSEDEPDFMQIYPGQERDFGLFAPGNYRAFILLRDDEYIVQHNVRVLPNGINFYRIANTQLKSRDSLSIKISKIITDRRLDNRYNDDEDKQLIKQSFNQRYINPTNFQKQIRGVVTDISNKPIAGVSVVIKGTSFGTSTNAAGEFVLGIPDRAVLSFASVGYEYEEMQITAETGQVFVKLKMSSNKLDEVVVVGYGVRKKANLTGSVSEITGSVNGLSSGIRIRGASTLNDSRPLIILNGVPFDGDISQLDTRMISIEVLDGATAKALYGSKAANGVLLLTAKNASAELPAYANTLRTNFRDDAFWQPRLTTDANGRASFKTKFPDDITNWSSHALAVSDKRQTGYSTFNIQSFKSLSANISIPQFALAGDSINMVGKILNYRQDTTTVNRKFYISDSLRNEKIISLKASHLDTFALRAIDSDSLRIKYTLDKPGFFDGEERLIPIFPVGSLETRGLFAMLEKDTSFVIKFDSSLGAIHIYAESSLLPVMLDETEKIRNYKYFCNEQLASKLKALLMEKKVFAYMKRDFRGNDDINRIIQTLIKNRSGQLWGWWPNNEISIWISLHVTEALLMAEGEKFVVTMDKKQIINFLTINLKNYKGVDRLHCLSLLKKLDNSFDAKQYVTDSSFIKRSGTLHELLREVELKQQLGLPVSVDSLISTQKKTMFGNIYWGEQGYKFFDNSIQNTILMYRILRNIGSHQELLKRIRYYFLEQRKDGQWRNTYESTLILETLLPDLMAASETPGPAGIIVTAKEKIETKKFPFSMKVAGVA